MLDAGIMHALGVMVARIARERATTADANDVIDTTPLLREWHPGAYRTGDVVTWEGLPVWCVQAHDSTATPDWTPAAVPALWAHYHGRDAAHALPFSAEGHNPYMNGHYCTDGGKAYRCKQDNTVHAPSVLPSAWEEA